MTADLDLFILENDCDPDACIESSTGVSDESATFTAVSGTTYFFVVDGFNAAVSDYTITVDCPTCSDDFTLDCSSNTDSWNNGNAGSTALNSDYGCNSLDYSAAPEYVYAFTAASDGEYAIDLTGLTADVDLFLLDATGGECDPSLCLDDSISGGAGDEQILFTATAGAAYYIVVDGFAGNTSDYDLTVTCNFCGTDDLVEDTVTCDFTTVSGNNGTGSSDVDSWTGCTTGNNTGPELFYEFSPEVSGDYTFELTGLSADIDLFVVEAAANGNCDTEACLDDSRAGGSNDESIALTLSNDTTYYIVVDGFAGNTSDFTLEVICPECSDDYDLNCTSSSDSWDNSFGNDDWDDYSLGGCFGGNEDGPEYVYHFTAATDGDVQIDLSGLSADLDLFVLAAGADGACSQDECVEDSTSGGSSDESLTLTVVAGETYYVVVDGFNGATSSYDITMSCI